MIYPSSCAIIVARRAAPARYLLLIFVLLSFFSIPVFAGDPNAGPAVQLPGLIDAAQVIRDTNGIAHIRAGNDHDLLFLQGYTHAQDRLFQMDYLRHAGSGSLAELFGIGALAQDVTYRTIGLRRAATRSLTLHSARMQHMLQAYADGVNAYLASHPLPPEYGALGITQLDPWQPLDSVIIGTIFSWQTNFNNYDLTFTAALMSYQQAGTMMGFNGSKLFFEDLFRSAPFDPVITIADGSELVRGKIKAPDHVPEADSKALDVIKGYLEKIKGMDLLDREAREGGGSNAWAVSGSFAANGATLFASDPHLTMSYPSVWYPIQLSGDSLDVIGNSFPGVPMVFLGHNRWISWGGTATLADIVDFYMEQLVPLETSPSGLATVYKGTLEPVIPIPETYRARIGGQLVVVPPSADVPAATLIAPRHGPIVNFNQKTGIAITVKWSGATGARDLDAALRLAEARNPAEFERAVRLFNLSQNFIYIDRRGNIAYYMSGEIPVREDLQSGFVAGLPPNLLRNGQGGNEWLPVLHPQPEQTLPYEILPRNEMPHVLNPPAGFLVQANNDPLGLSLDNDPLGSVRPGGGIYYLTQYFTPGLRAARITQLLKDKMKAGKVSFADMQKIQADTALLDPEYFVPFISQALENSTRQGASTQLIALAADPALVEAVGRLAAWDFTTPTGILEGYDAFDPEWQQTPPSDAEVASSVGATLYSIWRSELVKSVIDSKLIPYGLPVPDPARSVTALKNLLDAFPVNHGIGASGLNFFPLEGVSSPSDRRDIYILQALKSGLSLLSGNSFKNAFGNSTNQNDYRWGKLHRFVIPHVMGSVFNVPPAGGMFEHPLSNLAGIPVDGAWEAVDAAQNSFRADNENSFMWALGVSERSVAEGLPSGMVGVSSLPGGVSGVLGPGYLNLLPEYLVNGYYEQFFRMNELQPATESVEKYVP